MRLLRIGLALGLLAGGAAGVGAARLDQSACNVLKVELKDVLAAGVRDDMERGPDWASANLPADKLSNIKRLIELEEQLEFRCGVQHSHIAATAPAKAPGDKLPIEPTKKPAKLNSATNLNSTAKLSDGAKPAATPTSAGKPPTEAKKTAAAAPVPAAATTKKPPRRESTYVSPGEVNPYSLSRFGTTR
jgi:hypothetical protein